MVEGILHNKGVNPNIQLSGEGGYAVQLAKKYGIDYIGIECDEEELLATLTQKYGAENICGFYFLRLHKYYYKALKAPKADFIASFEVEEKFLHKKFNINFNPEKWYKNTFGKDFVYGRHIEYASPFADADANITQKIAAEHTYLRDQANLSNLYEVLNKRVPTLLIMGQNHVYADLPVLQHTFGKKYKLIYLSRRHRR